MGEWSGGGNSGVVMAAEVNHFDDEARMGGVGVGMTNWTT